MTKHTLKIFLTLSIFFVVGVHAANASSDLFNAIQKLDAIKVRDLLRAGANPNEVYKLYEGEQTPIIRTVYICRSFCSRPEDVKRTKDILSALISFGADRNAQDNQGRSALFHSLEYYSSPQVNFNQIALLLIRSGVDLNLQTDKGETVLMAAVQNLNIEIIRELFRYRFNPNLKNWVTRSKTALMIAIDQRDFSKETLSHASPERIAVIRELVSHKNVNIDLGDFYRDRYYGELSFHGYTALHYAIIRGEATITEILLDAGAKVDPGYQDTGETPLYFAIRLYSEGTVGPESRIPLIRLLLKAGANLNIAEHHMGASPLGVVFWTVTGNGGCYRECEKELIQVAQLLIEAGADPSQYDLNGITPLMLFSNSGNEQEMLPFISVFVSSRAKLCVRGAYSGPPPIQWKFMMGKTAYELAVGHRPMIAEILRAAGGANCPNP